MQVKLSGYLESIKPLATKLVEKLNEEYTYASLLGVDSAGKRYSVRKTGDEINDSNWNERGFVVRVHNGVSYFEYSFNELTEDALGDILETIRRKMSFTYKNISKFDVIEEEKTIQSFFSEVEIPMEEFGPEEKLQTFKNILNKALVLNDKLVDFRISFNQVHVSKIFLSKNRDLVQSYIWGEGYLVPLIRDGETTKYSYVSFSGMKGSELLSEMESNVEKAIKEVEELLKAERIVPGEYDIICTPEVTGLIAHEAFGHGVEMDMFVKNRAKAVEYINKPVASKLVTMHDGAAAAKHVSSYLFDDEGTLAKDTVIIRDGILERGLCDVLSALKLGVTPTGNGKRASYERKAYTRMTNTFFTPGDSTVDEMIKSIEFGYLLDSEMSGMEDPKNWGIQCMLLKGYEIKEGKLTGKIVSPVILTGYVPDLLESISMVSHDLELGGSGACGKGYKEWVKVSSGGPYIKAVGRLG